MCVRVVMAWQGVHAEIRGRRSAERDDAVVENHCLIDEAHERPDLVEHNDDARAVAL